MADFINNDNIVSGMWQTVTFVVLEQLLTVWTNSIINVTKGVVMTMSLSKALKHAV